MSRPSSIEVPDWETLKSEIATAFSRADARLRGDPMHAHEGGTPHAYHAAGHVVAGVRFGRPLVRVAWGKVVQQRRGVTVVDVDRDAHEWFGDGGVPFGDVNRVRAFIVTCWAGFAAETIYHKGRRYFHCASRDIKLLRAVTPIIERASRGLETAESVERDMLADTFRLLLQPEWWDDVVLIAEALRQEITLDAARVSELLSRRSAVRPVSQVIKTRRFLVGGYRRGQHRVRT